MPTLLEFYSRDAAAPCSDGYGTFDDIVDRWPDASWEANHEFIQWLFPLKTPSAFNPDAPLLTDSDIAAFVGNVQLQNRLYQAYERFLRFAGMKMQLEGGALLEKVGHRLLATGIQVKKGDNWADKEPMWQHPNHNWLRLTRVIASLKLLGCDACAAALFDFIQILYNEGYGSEESFGYWQKAAEGLVQ